MQPDILITVQENTDVASARREALRVASRAGFNEADAAAVGVIVTESSSNLIKHAGGGDLIVRDISSPGHPLLEMIAIDRGRGMANIARCFEDGYSTGGSPGTGLGAIARLSRFHDVYSMAEKGTVLLAQMAARGTGENGNRNSNGFLIGAVNLPYPGEEVCGDAWSYHVSPDGVRFVVADGLGHGVFAAEASHTAVEAVARSKSPEPARVIEDAHAPLRATRGAAIAVVDVDFRGERAIFAGVGNIAGAIVTDAGVKRQMVSINGTLGHQLIKPRQYEYPFRKDSLLILHSDGLSAHWSLDKYPGLLQKHPGVIAGVLLRDFRRTRDDATVVVMCWREATSRRDGV
jgi:anti-sigma regulatory factor (Ser/Thr protein kinase)/serine/threonine protein phosphatase PrpC